MGGRNATTSLAALRRTVPYVAREYWFELLMAVLAIAGMLELVVGRDSQEEPRDTRSPGESSRRQKPPDPEPELTEAEQEVLLGRPLAHGLTWEQYRLLTGENLFASGGFLRE